MIDRTIDRPALVRRHNPTVRRADPFSALTVGNGTFAFTADVTGLQTFSDDYAATFPLCTTAHWAWHSFPLPDGLRPETLRSLPYATERAGNEALFDHLRQNPHRLHLGRVGLETTRDAVTAIEQTLDLWTGVLRSRFAVDGQPFDVTTVCHPEHDLVAFRIESGAARVRLRIDFPYGSPAMAMADWTRPERHRTERFTPTEIARTLDDDRYAVRVAFSENATLTQSDTQAFRLESAGSDLWFAVRFSPAPIDAPLPDFSATMAASAAHWERFWRSGGVIDLSGSRDPRAAELERRIVLSQFVTAQHCAGPLPSAETGLLCNSWYGKFHLEMHWWHSVHFATWNRFPLFERSLPLYRRLLPLARETAKKQGLRGARWPKMIGPDGHDSPSPVGPLLIWQQPHPIYYAELCYRHRPNPATLDAWREIVFESAACMASLAVWDADGRRFVLGPPLKTVSENTDAATARNPTFELAYWRFGLRVAQTWRTRLGLPRDPFWDDVLAHLAPLPTTDDGRYLLQEGLLDTWTRWNWEHPALVGALGVQPGDGVEPETMRRTVRSVLETWRWDAKCWGWDFPMTAMAAARTGQPGLAVDALLLDVPKNRYAPNGHVFQRDDLPAYLPANGGLLAAVGMMAAGWTGSDPDRHAPGFPDDGTWTVRFESISPWL